MDTLKYPFIILKYLGLYSLDKRKRVIVACFYSAVMAFILFTTVVQFLSLRGSVFDFIDNMEELCAFGQHLIKVNAIVYQQETIIRLSNLRRYFLKIEKCPRERQTDLSSILQNVVRLQMGFICLAGTAVIFVVMSLLSGKAVLVGAWSIDGYDLLRRLVVISQATISPPVSFSTVAVDCIFLGFCAELIVQFKILCFRMRDMKLSEVKAAESHEEMKRCVRHHAFLLKFLKDLQKAYSSVIFVEYLAITPTICSEMYAVFETDNLALLIRYAVAGTSAVLQLAFYCIPADFVTSEALQLHTAIYENDWHTNYVHELRKPIPFIIQMSQKQVNFTAGGLFQINARALLSALKVSWSACTVMRVVKQKT